MASSFGALFLAGGLGGAIAFLSGLAFATSGGRVLALGAVGALLACAFQVTVVSGELVDPLQHELLNAACLANALGWLAGTLLVARVRVLEYLDAQEAA
jgi:predicted outer membrane lipoprotein